MSDLEELITAYRENTLELAGLFEAVEARGARPDDVHLTELAWLQRLREQGELDPAVAGALTRRLQALQSPDEPPAPPADDDATVVKPASRPPLRADDVATVVQPASMRPPADDDATVVKPATQHTGRTTGGRNDSVDQAGWRRIAEAQGGDRATVGMLLKGRFLLERELGRGGMGVVYLARDERKVEARDRDPYVAVKVLNDEFRRHPDSLIALQREARRAQQLGHDNIVRVYDFDKDGTIVFMTMEYIDGTDLRTLIRERAHAGMPMDEAWPLIVGMARALARAHANGVVHSDFKPGNVMVTREGVPKVFDFGIARAGKFSGEAAGDQTLFDAGTLGALTPAYASLEMIQGKQPAPGDDVYALGCVVFEMLTGKHPFDKHSAEVAMNEGRKPPPVPGLTKRQYKALCDAVAFRGGQRLRNAEDLVEGLRRQGLRERFGPILVGGAAAAAVLAAGGWALHSYLRERRVEEVVARFALADPHRYASEDQAVRALDGLGEEERKRVVLDQSELIQKFLLARLDGYWNPPAGRLDYAATQHVFQLRDRLKLFSTALDTRRNQIEDQRNELLNNLDTQLGQAINNGALFEDQPDNAPAVLARIRAIDPNSELLKNAELELKYDVAIGQSLADNKLEEARSRIALGLRLFPDSKRLKMRQSQLQGALAAVASRPASAQSAAPAGAMSPDEARRSLAALAAKPELTAEWQGSVAYAMSVLQNDAAPETRQAIDALGDAIAAQAAPVTDPAQLQQSLDLVNVGLRYDPQSPKLAEQRDRLQGLLQQQQQQLDQETASAEVTSRIESVRRAAAANDSAKAQESLNRIKSLQPANPFLAGEGPQLVSNAYIGRARAICQQGHWQDAANVAAQGVKALGNRPELRAAKERLDLAAAVMSARSKPLTDADYQRLQARYDAAQKNDPDGVKQLESDMSASGKLPQGGLRGVLAQLKTKLGDVVDGTQVGDRPTPAAGAGLAVTSGSDPCNQFALVGRGTACVDTLSDGSRGPSMVVIPGAKGMRPYAMTRSEISVGDFNRFCSTTRRCSELPAGGRDGANLPARNIYLSQARAYASWLTSMTGYAYRLPTDEEWTHAAQAGDVDWQQAPDSNCLSPSGRGSGGPSARSRGANPWGLLNLTGNVAEWVSAGGKVSVRGGSYLSKWTECTVANRRDDKGTPQSDVGFRLVRELK